MLDPDKLALARLASGALNDQLHYGCTDGHCQLVKRTGMHTNGGCNCAGRIEDYLTCLMDTLLPLQNSRRKGEHGNSA